MTTMMSIKKVFFENDILTYSNGKSKLKQTKKYYFIGIIFDMKNDF